MAQEMKEAVVAPNRTVTVGSQDFGPGMHVMLSVDEYLHLLAQGFIVDPPMEAVVAKGHTVQVVGGHQLTEGQTLMLPPNEYQRLKLAGSIVDPDKE